MRSFTPSVMFIGLSLFPFGMILAEAWFVCFNFIVQNTCHEHISDARATEDKISSGMSARSERKQMSHQKLVFCGGKVACD